MDNYCGNCRYSRNNDEKRCLECHKRSPIVTGGMMSDIQTVWPEVSPEDYCGDFVERESQPFPF